MKMYTCSACGKEFNRYPSAMKKRKGDAVFCSRKCSASRQEKKLHDLTCSQCGKTFYRKPSERKLNNNYCSRLCSNVASSQHIQNNPDLKHTKGRAITCQNCGDVFYVKPHRVDKAKFCSKSCAWANRFNMPLAKSTRNTNGANNPNFKNTNNHVTARQTAIKYFGHKCMICGWNIVVDVHHISPRRHGGKNTLDNLIVLCPNHHRMADLRLIEVSELKQAVLSAIAQLQDRQLLFDQLLLLQPQNDQPMPLFVQSEFPSQFD